MRILESITRPPCPPLPDGDADGGAVQTEDLPDLVFQIALIGEVEQPGVVAENDEMGRLGAGLGHVENLQAATLIRRRLHPGGGVGEDAVQRASGDAAGILGVNVLNDLKEPVHPLAGESGEEQHLGVEHVAETLTDFCLHVPHGVGFLVLHRVPFVDHDDGGFARFVDKSGDLGVLLGNAVVGVNEDQTHVARSMALMERILEYFSMASSTLLFRRIPAVSMKQYFPVSFSNRSRWRPGWCLPHRRR